MHRHYCVPTPPLYNGDHHIHRQERTQHTQHPSIVKWRRQGMGNRWERPASPSPTPRPLPAAIDSHHFRAEGAVSLPSTKMSLRATRIWPGARLPVQSLTAGSALCPPPASCRFSGKLTVERKRLVLLAAIPGSTLAFVLHLIDVPQRTTGNALDTHGVTPHVL